MTSRATNEFKMPPVGITETKVVLSGTTYVSYTVRCDAQNCWLVVTQPTRERAEKFLDDHSKGVKFPSGEVGWPKCPSPPLRESLPSGYKYIDKLWMELDDTLDGIIAAQHSGNEAQQFDLQGVAKGLAFCIVMLDKELWPNKAAVAKQATLRRKMRNGEIPYEETPSRLRGDLTMGQSREFSATDAPAVKTGKPTTATASKAKPAPALDPSVVASIKGGFASGLFSYEDLARMYKITVAEVKKITG